MQTLLQVVTPNIRKYHVNVATGLEKATGLAVATRTGKGQFSFQSQSKTMPKNVQTTAQLHSSHTLPCKHLPAMRETWVRSLGWEDPLEKETGNPCRYSCLEKSHGWRSLVGYSPCGCKELDMTE